MRDTTPYRDHFIIAGHNYSAHFGRLVGADYKSKVVFTDMDENVFEYEIGDVETMRPTEIERMDTGSWSPDALLPVITVGRAEWL